MSSPNEDDPTNEIMINKYIVLVGDPVTQTWSIAHNGSSQEEAYEQYGLLKADGTPAFVIATDFFVTV